MYDKTDDYAAVGIVRLSKYKLSLDEAKATPVS